MNWIIMKYTEILMAFLFQNYKQITHVFAKKQSRFLYKQREQSRTGLETV